MSKLGCDIKYMYRASTGHSFIFVVADEVTSYLVAIPLYKGTLHGIGADLVNYVHCKHGSLNNLIFDDDQVFYQVSLSTFTMIKYQN